uniref:Uncharacterized protein n=1 Tax=Pseudomonas phage RVTF4 TaxID=3236931 RepID=A0AB39CCH5_9VIRU
MEFKSRRDARFVLIKDQLHGIAQRLGYLREAELNQVGEISIDDGFVVDIRASGGIGMKIQHTMLVEVSHPDWDKALKFTIDVLGKNQCKNCYFPDFGNFGKDVDSLDDETWEDMLLLPELFADAVEELIFERYKAK